MSELEEGIFESNAWTLYPFTHWSPEVRMGHDLTRVMTPGSGNVLGLLIYWDEEFAVGLIVI